MGKYWKKDYIAGFLLVSIISAVWFGVAGIMQEKRNESKKVLHKKAATFWSSSDCTATIHFWTLFLRHIRPYIIFNKQKKKRNPFKREKTCLILGRLNLNYNLFLILLEKYQKPGFQLHKYKLGLKCKPERI